ncbi:MAG: GPP34 family phosphoprotein, partial [Phaeodactylibacter sp.]|nr:GPP34 family phosphoprotein [Phaeodactylibacter sp.]
DVLGRLKNFKKRRKVAYCIHYLAQRINKLRRQAIDNLIRKRILTRREEKILWVFKVNRYPSVDTEPEDTLRARLRQVIFDNAEPTPKERMLLAIVLAGKLEKALLPEKQERKAARQKINALTEDTEMRKYISQAVLEMQAAVMVAVVG